MVEDGSLIGLSQDEVEERFGKPYETDIARQWDKKWMLRVCIDAKWVVVNYDENGHVEAAELYTS